MDEEKHPEIPAGTLRWLDESSEEEVEPVSEEADDWDFYIYLW
jgi:hypothetical protein